MLTFTFSFINIFPSCLVLGLCLHDFNISVYITHTCVWTTFPTLLNQKRKLNLIIASIYGQIVFFFLIRAPYAACLVLIHNQFPVSVLFQFPGPPFPPPRT